MKSLKLCIFLIIVLTGCIQNSSQIFYQLVNENFLQFVDTSAYKSGRLIQIPHDSSTKSNFDKICISVDTSVSKSIKLKEFISTYVKDTAIKDFETILINKSEVAINSIDLSAINCSGKFILTKSTDQQWYPKCNVIAGKITFHQPYIAHNKAIIILSISESLKAGYTNAFLFRKQKGIWERIKTIEIERW